VDTLSNLAGSPLLEKVVGGSGGGGARLTPEGHTLLAAADRLHTARTAVVAQLDGRPALGAAALALRTSMRNTLPCSVHRVQPQAGAMNVQLQLPDGQMVTARVTRESAQLLGLTKGLNVLALCKATAVTVSAPADDTLPLRLGRFGDRSAGLRTEQKFRPNRATPALRSRPTPRR
jgi:molybdate transport system regulatory protein